MQKIRKILRTVSKKTALPIITNNTDLIVPRRRQSKNNKKPTEVIINKPEKLDEVCKMQQQEMRDR